jgi:hypothetical protein
VTTGRSKRRRVIEDEDEEWRYYFGAVVIQTYRILG